MSLQKRFKARYPKANFADFKTGDFFGKPNIFFQEGGEGTTVFDDDGKDFRSSIYFSKEMKRQLGLAPGFPLELCHNPNPKLEIPAVPFHDEALNTLKDNLVQQEIYVTPSEKFKIKFRDIFTDTVITHRSSHESRRWLAGPNFEYWPQQLNFALTDSELKLPPQVRSFFWFHVYFTVRRILFELGGLQNSLPLPGDTAFNQTENKYDNYEVKSTKCLKLLGVEIDDSLRFDVHINNTCKKGSKRVGVLMRLRNLIPTETKLQLYKAAILPYLTY